MSQPDNSSPQSGASDPQSGVASASDPNASSNTGQPAQSGAAADGAPAGGTPPAQTQATVSQADYDRLRDQLRAADKAREAAQGELRQIKDKDVPALEKANRDLVEATARAEKLEAEKRQLQITNAFLADNEHDWHDPQAALKLADLSKVEIDQADGTVRGMKDALTALSKSHPYLLKPKSADETKETPPAGTPPLNNAGAGGSGQASQNATVKRFPAMRTRLG